jgi:hypothetical protein
LLLAYFTGSRKLAKILIDTNKVANSLSRNTDLSDADLTTIFACTFLYTFLST